MTHNRSALISRSAWVCFGLGALLSSWLWWHLHCSDIDRIDHEFSHMVEGCASALDEQIREDMAVLRSVKALFDASDEVTASEFHSFADFLLSHYPSLAAVGWVPHVAATERAAFEAQMRAAGREQFEIMERRSQGDMVAAGARHEYFPIVFIEPLAGNQPAALFDLASSPVRRAAIEAARDSGEAQATARITLVQETGNEFAVLFLVPVYDGQPTTLEQRRAMLRGCVSGIFRFHDLLNAAGVHDPNGGEIHIVLQDETVKGDPVMLHTSRPAATDAAPPFLYRRPLKPAGGRQWVLVATPEARYMTERASRIPLFSFLCGLFGSALLALYLSMLGHERQRIEREVGLRTRELSEKSMALERMNESLTREEAQRRELQKRFADVVDHEQRRLGQELHDALGQQIAACSMLAQALQNRVSSEGEYDGDLLARLTDGIRTAQAQIRALSKGILPVPVDGDGLSGALADLVASVCGASDVAVVFRAEGDAVAIDNTTATHLYRIAQEALRNALEHGQGSCVTVTLQSDGAKLSLAIEDDGRGLGGERHTAGSGLSIMHHRAELIGASLSIDSHPEKGSTVVCSLG